MSDRGTTSPVPVEAHGAPQTGSCIRPGTSSRIRFTAVALLAGCGSGDDTVGPQETTHTDHGTGGHAGAAVADAGCNGLTDELCGTENVGSLGDTWEWDGSVFDKSK